MEKESSLEIMQLVVRRNLDPNKDYYRGDSKELYDQLTRLTHCRLDRENLQSVPLLDFLPCITNLYLQCNTIKKMDNFSSLIGLRFLTLAGNKISQVRGIKSLTKLGFLDLTDNCINSLDFTEVPVSVVILNISDNPCSESELFLDDAVKYLPNLKSLDGNAVNSNDIDSTTDEEESDDDIRHVSSDFEVFDRSNSEKSSGRNPASSDFLDTLTSEMGKSFHDISLAMSEREKQLHEDFDEFASVSASSPSINGGGALLKDEEIAALEREVAGIKVLKPLNVSKKFAPHPPRGSKGVRKHRDRPSSGGTAVTKIRTPGARPFNRVVK